MVGNNYELMINGESYNVEIVEYSPSDMSVGYRGDIDFRVTDENGNDITDSIDEDVVLCQLEDLWDREKSEARYDTWLSSYI